MNGRIPIKTPYKSCLPIDTSGNDNFNIEPYKKATGFTPSFRLNYTQTEAIQNIQHKSAWNSFLKSNTPHAIIFDYALNAEDTQLSIYLENLIPPKDWDIIAFSETQYILNRRAAKILSQASLQFNTPINKYIRAFEVLKVIQVKTP